MFKYSIQTEIRQPLEEVVKIFTDRKLFPLWQPGLVSDIQLEGKDGLKKYKLTFKSGRRKIIITETVIRNKMPHHYDVQYVMRGVTNDVFNSFSSLENGNTLWKSEHHFFFKGLMKWIATYMRGGFEKQCDLIVKNFKGFAESRSRWRGGKPNKN